MAQLSGDGRGVGRQKKLKEAVAKVGETLHHQYMIGYYPFGEGTEGKWRRIQVKLPPTHRGQSLRIYARGGYHALAR